MNCKTNWEKNGKISKSSRQKILKLIIVKWFVPRHIKILNKWSKI